MSAPGIAGDDAFEGQPASFEWSVLTDGFCSICRAGGCVTTGRTNMWRDGMFVEADHSQQQFTQRFFYHPVLNVSKVGLIFLQQRNIQEVYYTGK